MVSEMTEIWAKWVVTTVSGDKDHGFGPVEGELPEAFRCFDIAYRQDENARLKITMYQLEELNSYEVKGTIGRA